MYKTLTTALGGATLLLGASLAQADVVTLSDTELDGVTAGSTFTGPFFPVLLSNAGGINGSFVGDGSNHNVTNSFRGA